MTQGASTGEHAYDAVIATTYEADRRTEPIWELEQAYIRRTIARMPPDATVLDAPIGTGRFVSDYEARGVTVLGVDLSQAMLDQAQRRIATDRVRLQLADVRSIPSPESCFDHVVCWRLLHLLPPDDLDAVFREIARVVRPGGHVHLQAYVRDRCHPLLALIAALRRRLNALRGRASADGTAGRTPWSHIRSYAHEDRDLRACIGRSGLVIRAVHVLGAYGSLRLKVFVLSRI